MNIIYDLLHNFVYRTADFRLKIYLISHFWYKFIITNWDFCTRVKLHGWTFPYFMPKGEALSIQTLEVWDWKISVIHPECSYAQDNVSFVALRENNSIKEMTEWHCKRSKYFLPLAPKSNNEGMMQQPLIIVAIMERGEQCNNNIINICFQGTNALKQHHALSEG